MKLDKEEMAAASAAPAGRPGDPPREAKALLAPCPGTVPAHELPLILNMARALLAHGDTGEEGAVIHGRGGDDGTNPPPIITGQASGDCSSLINRRCFFRGS
jgi:hypothetical protein